MLPAEWRDRPRLVKPVARRVLDITTDPKTVGHVESLIAARAVQFTVNATNSELEPCLDELEVWSAPAAGGQPQIDRLAGVDASRLKRLEVREKVHLRGVDPLNLLGLFRGVNHGGWDPNEKNFHLYTIVIGAQTLHATGYAMGMAKDGADSAVVAYFGDGATSQGDVAESFTFSAVYNAPVVFFCQNNQWAISEPTEKQSRVPLYQRAQGYGFPGVRVDGNDVLACLAVTKWALERARGGEGPALIEAFTYRMGAHTTSDDPTRYRRDEEREAWEAKDPILRLRAYLAAQGHADEGFFAELEAESETLGKRVRDVVRAMPDPEPMSIFENIYADGHALVDEERAQFAAYQASFADAPANAAAGGEVK